VLTPQARRVLRSLQLRLSSSIPIALQEGVDRNDSVTWAALTMLEMRMLLARGQVHQARQIAEILPVAGEAGLPVESYERREIQQLINAIDSALAGRNYLALQQLEQVAQSPKQTIQWATQMWRSRVLAAEGNLANARQAAVQSIELAHRIGADAAHWASCFAAEVWAKAGDAPEAERRVLQVVSQFVEWGEVRGVSMAYLSLARVHRLAGAEEDSDAAAALSYETDGSWTGPVIWLAWRALAAGDVAQANDLLRSIPSPTTDAYNLVQALALIEARQIPLEAVTWTLEAAARPPNGETVDELRQVLASHPAYLPAREALVWKLLSVGRLDEAKGQLEAMVEGSADVQSIAAVRLGLQMFSEEQIFDQLFADFSRSQSVGEDYGEESTHPGSPSPSDAPAPTPAPQADSEAIPAGAEDKPTGFVGQLSLFSVPDLLQFFCNSRRTGLLAFSSQCGEARIRLHEGSLCWALSPTHPSLGEFLLHQKTIGAEHLQLAADPEQVGGLYGQEGVDGGRVRDGVREMLHLTLKELVDWTDGWFVFDGIRDTTEPPAELQFNAQGILLDVLREIDEERRDAG